MDCRAITNIKYDKSKYIYRSQQKLKLNINILSYKVDKFSGELIFVNSMFHKMYQAIYLLLGFIQITLNDTFSAS